MSFRDKYRLELRWESERKMDFGYLLSGAYFDGPALKISKEVNKNDSLVLDLTPQYSKILSSHYFVTLSWGDLKYDGDKVSLCDVKLSGDFIGSYEELNKNNYIVIDTALHEESTHVFNLVYAAQFVDDASVAKC